MGAALCKPASMCAPGGPSTETHRHVLHTQTCLSESARCTQARTGWSATVPARTRTCTCMHTCTHAHTHTHAPQAGTGWSATVPARTHTCMHTCMHKHIHTRTRTARTPSLTISVYAHVVKHRRACTARTQSDTLCACTCAQTQTCAHPPGHSPPTPTPTPTFVRGRAHHSGPSHMPQLRAHILHVPRLRPQPRIHLVPLVHHYHHRAPLIGCHLRQPEVLCGRRACDAACKQCHACHAARAKHILAHTLCWGVGKTQGGAMRMLEKSPQVRWSACACAQT